VPNTTVKPNTTARTKSRTGSETLERTLAALEVLEQRLMAAHVADFTAVEVTMAQAKLLYVVISGGPQSMSEIAGNLGISISTASGAVDHLVQLGLLARTDDPRNRRQVRVSATPKGIQTIEQMRDLGARHFRNLIERLGERDLRTIERAIRVLTAAIPTDQESNHP
jgi:DNA-binding MarR family transcriptional regulator